MNWRGICRRRTERALHERERVSRVGGCVAGGPVVHLVKHVPRWHERLRPQRLDAADGPRVVGVVAHHVDRVKVHLRRLFGLHNARDEYRPLHGRAAELRAREGGHVADHHRRRVAPLADGEGAALAARAEARVVDDHDGHAEGGPLVHRRGGAREQQVHVVLRGVEERLPQHLRRRRRRGAAEPQRRRRQHHKVRGRGAQVLGRADALLVLRARDPRARRLRGALLALEGAEDAHSTSAALAARRQVARLTMVHLLLLRLRLCLPHVASAVGRRHGDELQRRLSTSQLVGLLTCYLRQKDF